MTTIRLTMAQALTRYLAAQTSEVDGREVSLFSGVFAIFGHGNVAGLGEALYEERERLPTLRAHNEQGMALAAVAFAKASRRRRMMACTSSIGPGATNMVTAAAVAHANRLPLLLLPGDIFASRRPDPVPSTRRNMFAPKDRPTSISATGKRDERLGCIFVRRAERRCFGRPTLGQMVSALPSVLFMTPTSHRLRYRSGRSQSTSGSFLRTICGTFRGGRPNRYGSCGSRTDATLRVVRKKQSREENSCSGIF